MALTPVVLMTFLGFASALLQAQTFSSAKIRMAVLVLVLRVCRIGEVSHSGPDAEVFSFVLGTSNPTGLRCKAMYVTELMSYGGVWAVSETRLCSKEVFAPEPFRRQSTAMVSLLVPVTAMSQP
jgi:hypothetical protein